MAVRPRETASVAATLLAAATFVVFVAPAGREPAREATPDAGPPVEPAPQDPPTPAAPRIPRHRPRHPIDLDPSTTFDVPVGDSSARGPADARVPVLEAHGGHARAATAA